MNLIVHSSPESFSLPVGLTIDVLVGYIARPVSRSASDYSVSLEFGAI